MRHAIRLGKRPFFQRTYQMGYRPTAYRYAAVAKAYRAFMAKRAAGFRPRRRRIHG
jgi:hypothetical protein